MQHEKAANELHELHATAISQDNGLLAAATSQTKAENARAEQYFREKRELLVARPRLKWNFEYLIKLRDM
jgi:hypothetical protein